MERIVMIQEERDWLEWLKRVQAGVMTQRQAAQQRQEADRLTQFGRGLKELGIS